MSEPIDPRIPLKDAWLAGLLAYLIPGAGHLYQGRTFKGLLYFVCILGTFLYGMHLGEWKVVSTTSSGFQIRRLGNIGYMAQALVGLPALPALLQSSRYRSPENEPLLRLDEPLSAQFTGLLSDGRTAEGAILKGRLSGRISLHPEQGAFGPETRGTFEGTLNGEHPIELTLGGSFFLERKIAADSGRMLTCEVIQAGGLPQPNTAGIVGSVPRSFRNWFQVPLEDKALDDLHGRLGKFYELAMVYTWIAGLLNILAIWDALEGPAYGYGDEDEEESEKDKKKPAESAATTESATKEEKPKPAKT